MTIDRIVLYLWHLYSRYYIVALLVEKMKVVIENIVASCKLEGDLELDKVQDEIEGAIYEPEVFEGITYECQTPPFKSFILPDGSLRFHGITSEHGIRAALDKIRTFKTLSEKKIEEQLQVMEIVASVDMEQPIDAKMIYEEFQKEGIIYDPAELPGFILSVGSTGIEVLIFPEGKLVSKGAKDLMDAVSSLQMVYNRIAAK
jgi:TATA-box binding protein (TBP) (component of TFIID and TFIIIB)